MQAKKNDYNLIKNSLEVSNIQKPKIYHLTIANDKFILTEYTKYKTIYDDYKINILKILETGRKIIVYKKVEYVYIKDDKENITFLALISSGFPRQTAFKMLDFVRSHFYATFQAEKIKKSGFFSLDQKYKSTLEEMLKSFSDFEAMENTSIKSGSTNRSRKQFDVVNNSELLKIISQKLIFVENKQKKKPIKSIFSPVKKPQVEKIVNEEIIVIKKDIATKETAQQTTGLSEVETENNNNLGLRKKLKKQFIFVQFAIFQYVIVSQYCGFGLQYCINNQIENSESTNHTPPGQLKNVFRPIINL